MKVDFEAEAGKLRAVAAKLEVAIPACERPLVAQRSARVQFHQPPLLPRPLPRLMPARPATEHRQPWL